MDNLDWEEKTNRNNSPILPKSIRGLIVGKSGCGKTNLLLNLLLKPELLDYNKLFVYGKSLFQPKYKILKFLFKKMERSDQRLERSGPPVLCLRQSDQRLEQSDRVAEKINHKVGEIDFLTIKKIFTEGKFCTKCNKFKYLYEYHKNKSKLMGVESACKECNKPRYRLYYQNNKEEFKKRFQDFKIKNPYYQRNYYKNNKIRNIT